MIHHGGNLIVTKSISLAQLKSRENVAENTLHKYKLFVVDRQYISTIVSNTVDSQTIV